VDIPQAAGMHAAILRAVAARNEAGAAEASQRMMAFLLEFTEHSRRNAPARRSKAPTKRGRRSVPPSVRR